MPARQRRTRIDKENVPIASSSAPPVAVKPSRRSSRLRPPVNASPKPAPLTPIPSASSESLDDTMIPDTTQKRRDKGKGRAEELSAADDRTASIANHAGKIVTNIPSASSRWLSFPPLPFNISLETGSIVNDDLSSADTLQLVKEIARGGFGAVFKANLIGQPSQVYAVKILLTANQHSAAKLRTEFEHQHASSSDCVAPVLAIGMIEHPQIMHYVAMPLAVCVSRLSSHADQAELTLFCSDLRRCAIQVLGYFNRWEDEEEVQIDNWSFNLPRCLKQVCDGVAHIHDQYLAHRDLKPENVLLYHEDPYSNGLVAKISDFGLCIVGGPTDDEEPYGGTPPYSGPFSLFRELNKTISKLGPEHAASKASIKAELDECEKAIQIRAPFDHRCFDIYAIYCIALRVCLPDMDHHLFQLTTAILHFDRKTMSPKHFVDMVRTSVEAYFHFIWCLMPEHRARHLKLTSETFPEGFEWIYDFAWVAIRDGYLGDDPTAFVGEGSLARFLGDFPFAPEYLSSSSRPSSSTNASFTFASRVSSAHSEGRPSLPASSRPSQSLSGEATMEGHKGSLEELVAAAVAAMYVNDGAEDGGEDEVDTTSAESDRAALDGADQELAAAEDHHEMDDGTETAIRTDIDSNGLVVPDIEDDDGRVVSSLPYELNLSHPKGLLGNTPNYLTLTYGQHRRLCAAALRLSQKMTEVDKAKLRVVGVEPGKRRIKCKRAERDINFMCWMAGCTRSTKKKHNARIGKPDVANGRKQAGMMRHHEHHPNRPSPYGSLIRRACGSSRSLIPDEKLAQWGVEDAQSWAGAPKYG